MTKIYNFQLEIDWKLILGLSDIDNFRGTWPASEQRERQGLKELKAIATILSTGSSTRIEGAKITDAEVAELVKNIGVSKLGERDAQEVAGYYETLDAIIRHYDEIDISENNIKQLHNLLMKYSEKDTWHKGDYKQHSNVVEATNPDGIKYVVFRTTQPGIETWDAMRNLVAWYNGNAEEHPLIRAALFVYDFLSIHPFQDGNGRMSRLLTTLMMLRLDYTWIQYISFEQEIEKRKSGYYQVLMECQRQRPGENVYPWLMFFLNCVVTIQNKLNDKIQQSGIAASMTVRERKIYMLIESNPGVQSGEIAGRLGIPLPTVKRILAAMSEKNLLGKHGTGRGTNYTVQ